MAAYLALLRGVNVGGKGKLSMADLRDVLTTAGFKQVTTYINSGNVIFNSATDNTTKLSNEISTLIADHFALNVDVVVLSQKEWSAIINQAPKWWGHDDTRKHNILVLLKPYDMADTMKAIGVLKPDIESAEAGKGVIYQSISLAMFGRTNSGKLAGKPIYKCMTIRNFNTATKLKAILEQAAIDD